MMFEHNSGNLFGIGDVADFKRSAFAKFAAGLSAGNVAANDVGVTINLTKFQCQLRTDLACSTDDQNIFHD